MSAITKLSIFTSQVFSFLAMILFGVLCLIMICNYCVAKSEEPNQPIATVYSTQPQATSLHESTSVSPHPETDSLPHVTPTAPSSSLLWKSTTHYLPSSSPPNSPTNTLPYAPSAPSSTLLRESTPHYLPSPSPPNSPTNTLPYAPSAPSSTLLRESTPHYLPLPSPPNSPTNTLPPSAPTPSLLRGNPTQYPPPYYASFRPQTNTLQNVPSPPLPRLSRDVSSHVSPSAPAPPMNSSLYGSVQAPSYESIVASQYNNSQYVRSSEPDTQ